MKKFKNNSEGMAKEGAENSKEKYPILVAKLKSNPYLINKKNIYKPRCVFRFSDWLYWFLVGHNGATS